MLNSTYRKLPTESLPNNPREYHNYNQEACHRKYWGEERAKEGDDH
jgi:hypothetical protein